MSNQPVYVVIRVILRAGPSAIDHDPIPVGGTSYFVGEIIPCGYIEPQGQILSIDEYPELYVVVGDFKPRWWQFRSRIYAWRLRQQREFRAPNIKNHFQFDHNPSTKD